jgi:hypothetical protein
MMIKRAQQTGLISEDAERRLWINASRRGWRKEEPFDSSTEPEEPRLLRRSFELVLSEGNQTPDDVLANLALPPADIESLSGLPEGFLRQDFSRVALRGLRTLIEPDDENERPASVIQLPPRPRTF